MEEGIEIAEAIQAPGDGEESFMIVNEAIDHERNHQTAWINPLDMPTGQFMAGLDRRKRNRDALIQWIRGSLVDKVDYGRIHIAGQSKCDLARQGRSRECKVSAHWSKPSLFKAGAEKICGMLGVTATFPNLHEYERAILAGMEIKTVILRCNMLSVTGKVVSEGIGARSVAKDDGDINKSLKMAAKSSYIDATLRMGGLSELFTQDVEDMSLDNDKPASMTTVSIQQSENPKPVYPQDRFDQHFKDWSKKIKAGMDSEVLISGIRKAWDLPNAYADAIRNLPACPPDRWKIELEVYRKLIAGDMKTKDEACSDLRACFSLTTEQINAIYA